MSEHHAHIKWQKDGDFSHEGYNSAHSAEASGQSLAMATANTEQHVDPEQALAMSLASCHMLTFLALAAKKRLVVEHYEDNPIAYVEQNEDGKYYVPRIRLRPQVRFAGEVKASAIESMHHKAHQHCFISNSLQSEVMIEPQ